MTAERQSSALPPAQPSYIFRGHTAQIHSVQIVCRNTCLVTGDADGWIIYWKLESKRPVAVWRAHDAAILGTAEWGSDRVLTHGRDTALRIWQLRPTDESNLSTVLPADGVIVHRPKPWLLHTLPVNTLNFCSFSVCYKSPAGLAHEGISSHISSTRSAVPIFVAVPARDDRKIEVYQFPDENLAHVIPRVQTTDTGMVMAVKLVHHHSNNILVIAGYESGYTAVHLLSSPPQTPTVSVPQSAQIIYLSRPHSQPILSLDVLPDGGTYFTSSADAIIAAHRIPDMPLNFDEQGAMVADQKDETLLSAMTIGDNNEQMSKVSSTRGSGAISTNIRGDVVPSSQQSPLQDLDQPRNSEVSWLKETGSRSQHPAGSPGQDPLIMPSSGKVTFEKRSVTSSSSGSSPLTFRKKNTAAHSTNSTSSATPSGLSSLLLSTPLQPKMRPEGPPTFNTELLPAYKIVNTKHAGQQSLKVRSDGRILVTGGWDSRIRIYSTKTLKEVAVLKWHNEGVYAAAFGEVLDDALVDLSSETGEGAQSGEGRQASVLAPGARISSLNKLKKQREEQLQRKHWVAAGAKDGKVSIWEVF